MSSTPSPESRQRAEKVFEQIRNAPKFRSFNEMVDATRDLVALAIQEVVDAAVAPKDELIATVDARDALLREALKLLRQSSADCGPDTGVGGVPIGPNEYDVLANEIASALALTGEPN